MAAHLRVLHGTRDRVTAATAPALAPPLTESLDVPRHLKAKTRAWYQQVCERWELSSAQLRLLELACVAWEEHEAARAAVKRDGLMIIGSDGTPRLHPCVVTGRSARAQFAALIAQLDLDEDEVLQ